MQTRKNEEYKALTHEIEMAKEVIFKIEDAQIVLMEQAEAAQKEVARATTEAAAAKKLVDDQIGQLDQREDEFEAGTGGVAGRPRALAGAVDDSTRNRYERLFKSKGENVVVGIEHSACGGCHMKLPAQVVTNCRAPGGNLHLPELRPDSVFHPRHESDGGGLIGKGSKSFRLFFPAVDSHRAAEQVNARTVASFSARIFSATASCAG